MAKLLPQFQIVLISWFVSQEDFELRFTAMEFELLRGYVVSELQGFLDAAMDSEYCDPWWHTPKNAAIVRSLAGKFGLVNHEDDSSSS